MGPEGTTIVRTDGASYRYDMNKLDQQPGAITLPLSGSSSAIAQLLKSCPVLANDLAAGCY